MDALSLVNRIERDLASLKQLLGPDAGEKRVTGCRHARGSHGIAHVYDVLGTDDPPEGWPHPRPTASMVAAARRKLDAEPDAA